MKHLVIMKAFLIFLGLAVACGADFEPGLKVKFGVLDAFISLYMTEAEAIDKGYKLTPGPEIPYNKSVMNLYCPPEKDDKTNKALCLYMDAESGHICGMNIAIPHDEVVFKNGFNSSIQGWSEWDVQKEDGTKVSYLTKQLFYCSSEFLKKPLEERIASRKENKVLPEKAIWVTGLNNKLDRISTSKADLERSGYTKQGFFVGMGQHFYKEMTPETLCTDSSIDPWFCLTQKDEVIGVGLMILSKINNDFFENPGAAAVKMIVPDGPDCLSDMAVDGGVRTLHFYFIEKPFRSLLWPL